MDQPKVSAATGGPEPVPVLNVPVGWCGTRSTGPLSVRVTSRADVPMADDLALDRVVWFEVPPALVDAPWPVGAPLDVVLDDPTRDAAGLYGLDRIRRDHPVRVTIPGRPGVARSARIAMALQLPVRLLTYQPSSELLTELDEVLDIYLHDSRATAPAEFLQSALAWWLFDDAPSPWVALELDPDWYPRLGVDAAATGGPWPPPEAGFVSRRLRGLTEAGGECATCRFRGWCQGFFKWPDSAYECAGVARFIGRLEDSAARLSQDLDEARSLER